MVEYTGRLIGVESTVNNTVEIHTTAATELTAVVTIVCVIVLKVRARID